MKNNKGQLTIFILIAVFVVGAVAVFFVFGDSLITTEIPVSIEPVYNTFLSCLEEVSPIRHLVPKHSYEISASTGFSFVSKTFT